MPDRVRLDNAAIDELLTGPAGPVAKGLTRATVRIERDAKRMCPVDTGRLRSSIGRALDRDARGLVGVVGTDVDYAAFVELGTSRAGAQPFLRPALAAEASRRA